MKYFRYIIFFLFLISGNLYAQLETYNWYFGDSAGVTFLPDGTGASALTDGITSQMEGVSTISDRKGKILFYSDGRVIWNSGHKILWHGGALKGNYSSSRSVILLPRPQSNRYYYAFTISAAEECEKNENGIWKNKNGVRYSLIDAQADNWRGDIDTNYRNVLLLEDAVEQMVTVNHSNLKDIWLIVYNWADNYFYVWAVTKNGIDTIPQKFKRPLPAYPDPGNARFNLDYDYDTKRLIACEAGRNSFVIYNFDPSNGRINTDKDSIFELTAYPDSIKDTAVQVTYIPYSGCFSPDGKKFYGSCFSKALLQYDFSNTMPENLRNSYVFIADERTHDNYDFGAVRKGPDGRIYVARNKAKYLSIINKPNNKGSACDFVADAVDLKGKKARYGLPLFMNYKVPPCDFSGYAGKDINTCYGEEIKIGGVNLTLNELSYEWNPKDFLDDPYILNPKCRPEHDIEYVLTITDEVIGCVDYDTVFISVNTPPSIQKADDAVTCENATVTLGNSANPNNLRYFWTPTQYLDNPYIKNPICTPTENMTYILRALDTNTGCSVYDTIDVFVNAIDTVIITGDSYICEGGSTTLGTQPTFSSYLWSNGDTTATTTISQAGTYWVRVTDELGCEKTTYIDIDVMSAGSVRIHAPEALCSGGLAELSLNANFAKYLWFNGDTTATTTISQAGTYWVIVENSEGCQATDTVMVEEYNISYQVSRNEINFGSVCEAKVDELSIQNNGIDTFKITDVYIKNGTATFTTSFTSAISVVAGGSVSVIVNFVPQVYGDYYDTLVIAITEPCESLLKIPLKGTYRLEQFVLSSDDIVAEPSDTLLLPLRIDLEHSGTADLPVTFDFTYRYDVLDIYKIEGAEVISEQLNGNVKTLHLSTSLPAGRTNLTIYISTLVLLGQDTLTQFTMDNFTTNAQCYEFTASSNSILLSGCIVGSRRVGFFSPTEMEVRVSNDAVICDIKGDMLGNYILQMFDIEARLIATESWNNTTNIPFKKEVFFSTANVNSGTYFIMLTMPNGYLTKSIVVIK